ncbi:M64 family metallopeptidase [Chitinimonas lacunae]|uniref:M64 family metallopeptidase n=1 Tax=Chitinimonas lacunae TaxID=1963018 RepID=A0ABV8MNV0_9NEIS
MNGKMWTMALLAGAVVTQAQAQSTWALRFDAQGTWSGQKLELVAAERGDYAVSPELIDQDGDFKIVARDAAGRVLYMQSVADPRRLQAESFDPVTGRIVEAREIQLSSGQFELRIPARDDVASIAIEIHEPGMRAAGATTPTTAAVFRREDIEGRIADTGMRMRTAKAASSTAMLYQSGPSSQRFDIVLIGDGYTAAEQAKWQADAKRVADGLLADPLFNAHRGALNIRRVDVISAQSGIDDLTYRTYRDTALGMNIGCYGLDRLVCADDNLVYSAVGSVTPADGRDVIIAVGNTTRYGGAGGRIATMTMHASAIELALHEIGHTAFGLADEYDYGTCSAGEPSEKNATRQTARNYIKWGDLIQSTTPVPTPVGRYSNGTIGLFSGSRYCKTGVYRPTEDSRMRTLGRPWHAVNERIASAVIASHYKPDEAGTTTRGTLSGTGATATHPSPYHYTANGGEISASLTGPANADFELILLRWNGSAWVSVASSTSPTSTELIRYTANAGYYSLQVKSYSGSGAYELKYELPR